MIATDIEAAELFLAHRETPDGHRAGDIKKESMSDG